MKIIDKIKEGNGSGQPFCSFEYFPPKTAAGVENLYTRIDRMAALEPLFIDVTWGAAGSTAELTLEISKNAQKFLGQEVMMHLTCTNLCEEKIKEALKEARAAGIQNVLALRGDPPKGATDWAKCKGGLSYAIDLVRLIRKEHGDYFCIGVAGHPEGHMDSPSIDEDIKYLKAKVDAGADFIISQFFYDAEIFIEYVSKCRAVGITCPILPGIMPIQSYASFKRMTGFCRTQVPQAMWDELAPIRDDDEAVKNWGITCVTAMCRRLIEAGAAPGIHFYTLNLEKSTKAILESLGMIETATTRRQFPWRSSKLSSRSGEDVRPINWANRPKSYLSRTQEWDEFPNGRWGDGRSPAFGELSNYHFVQSFMGTKEDRRAMWGEAPQSVTEVYEVFARYVRGEIPYLPWCEVALQPETTTIVTDLVRINQTGFLTINSQPAVNGARSDHSVFGWGGPGGRVYQKAYVECFTSPHNLKRLMEACSKRPSLHYYAVDCNGNTYFNGSKKPTAVTWGVFPNKEILQPTIFDPNTFLVWKDEAFQLWLSVWASIYDDESASSALNHHMHDTYFLVAVLDNDFINSSHLWSALNELTEGAIEGVQPHHTQYSLT